MMIREGVDTIKVNISGDNFVRPRFSEALAYTDEEVAAAAEQAHEWGVWLACHARACAAVKMALRHNFRVIYHCDFADEECLDQLEAKKNEVFVAPAIGIVYTTAYEASAWGITKEVAEHMGNPARRAGAARSTKICASAASGCYPAGIMVSLAPDRRGRA